MSMKMGPQPVLINDTPVLNPESHEVAKRALFIRQILSFSFISSTHSTYLLSSFIRNVFRQLTEALELLPRPFSQNRLEILHRDITRW